MRFEMCLGVAPGYGVQFDGDAVAAAGAAWQEAAEQVWKESKIYIGAVVTPARVVYRQEWKCPVGGEICVMIVGHGNPTFIKDRAPWDAAVRRCVEIVKGILQQKTATAYLDSGEVIDLR